MPTGPIIGSIEARVGRGRVVHHGPGPQTRRMGLEDLSFRPYTTNGTGRSAAPARPPPIQPPLAVKLGNPAVPDGSRLGPGSLGNVFTASSPTCPVRELFRWVSAAGIAGRQCAHDDDGRDLAGEDELRLGRDRSDSFEEPKADQRISKNISRTLHVWYIYLHWGGLRGQCRYI